MTFCQTSSAELTSSDQTQEEQITQPSTYVYNENACPGIETQFQNYLINIMDSTINASAKSYNCLMGGVRNSNPDCEKLNSMNLGNLKDYRESLKKLYQEMANHWVREKSKQDVRFKACLDLPVRFERNIRIVKLKDKPDLPDHSCQFIVTRWPHELDQLTQEYFDGKRRITSLNPEEIAHLKAFHSSPLKRVLSTNALFDTRLSDLELKQKLASAYNDIRIGIEKFKKKVSELKDHEKYILFEFQNQFTVFKNTLPAEERSKATRCMRNSRFVNDCTINVSRQGSRCLSRLQRLGRQLLPIVPVIDSIGGMGDVMAAEASGAMTSSEASQKRAELATLGMLGLGGIAAGASIARSLVGSAVKASIVRTSRSKTAKGSSDALSSLPKLKPPKNLPSISRQQLISSHNRATTRLERMGVNYSPVSDVDSYTVGLAKRNAIGTRNFDPSDPPVQGILRIREGATKGKRHTNSRGLALKHKDIDAKIKKAESVGVKVVVDTSLSRKGAVGYYSPKQKILAINPNSNWLTFEREFQHALFDNYLKYHTLRDSPLSSARLISKSGQSLKQMRQQLPAEIRRDWSRREQNTILRYMRDDVPESALNQRLSVNRELEMLGWSRYTPSGQRISNQATRGLINELDDLGRYGPLTARQRSIRNQAYTTHYGQTYGLDAAQTYGVDATIVAGTAGVIGTDLAQKEDSFLLNLPKNIQSAIQSADEVLYSARGILVKDQNGQVSFFSSEKKK